VDLATFSRTPLIHLKKQGEEQKEEKEEWRKEQG
jgi:hypothetical protein